VTVTGDNVDAAAQPFISVTVVVTRFNSTDDDDSVDDDDVRTPTTDVISTSEVRCRNPLEAGM